MKTIVFIIFALFAMISVKAQVGVNNPTPEQALDVNGKIKLTDDDTTPSAGTVRFNRTETDFEGYNGVDWQSFTKSRNGIPSNAIFVSGKASRLAQGSTGTSVTFRDQTNTPLIDPSVPVGKFLLVTGIHISGTSLLDFDTEDPLYHIRITFGGANSLEIKGKYTGGTFYQNNGGYAPIGVVGSNGSLSITNFELAASLEQLNSGIEVLISGFLVDDLNFD